MSISIREFKVAMETYGAERLYDCLGSRYGIMVPRFKVGGVSFIHSGSYYIVPKDGDVPEIIMDQAMAELGEEHPGGDHFWWGEIHSIKGMLTLVAILDGKYSKELVDELTNETYKKLLSCPEIQNIPKFLSPKMQELRKLLVQYDNMVNPFANSNLKLKEPIEYLDKIKIFCSIGRVDLMTKLGKITFNITDKAYYYSSMIKVQKNGNLARIDIGHYYPKEHNTSALGEEVRLCYRARDEEWCDHPENIDLNISLKTGKAEKRNLGAPPMYVLATDEQIETVITYLKMSIRKIKKEIISHMVEK